MEETKICSRCKRELPLTMYTTNRSTKDGLQSHCRDCQRYYDQTRKERKKAQKENNNTLKIGKYEELSRFTPRQLMEELKARGYKWDYMLEPQRQIYYHKI